MVCCNWVLRPNDSLSCMFLWVFESLQILVSAMLQHHQMQIGCHANVEFPEDV